MWQIEIAYLNILHGWPFAYLFTWITVDNWAAKDFFYLVQAVAFILTIIASFELGRKIEKIKINS